MSRQIKVGGIAIGGGAPVSIQSMTNTPTHDVEATLKQIRELATAGCEIVRVAVPDERAARAVGALKAGSPVPLVADIHFDYRLALIAAEQGIDKIRINPGNIGSADRVEAVANACKERGIPIRIGVNGGSLDKKLLEKYGHPTAEALVESALLNVAILEKYGVQDIAVSVKASDVALTVNAYMLLANRTSYPLHLGVTEAGTTEAGVVKSAVGIGALLLNGVGDTIRVSLTDDPVREVYAAKHILRACGLDEEFVEVVACPTCGRCEWESMSLANKVTEFVRPYNKRAKIAVMGCVVNGPGEARDADLGIAGGKGSCLIFKKGEPYKKVAADCAEEEFFKEIRLLLDGE